MKHTKREEFGSTLMSFWVLLDRFAGLDRLDFSTSVEVFVGFVGLKGGGH